MREYLSGDDIANQISMMRSSWRGAVLVVEGSSDLKMYARFADPSVAITIAHSKEKVLEVVRLMREKRHDDKVLGIVDADLDLVLGKKREPPVFATDLRDMEMMAISSPAFDSVMVEYGLRNRVESFQKRRGPLAQAVVDACYSVGVLMRISHDRSLSLSFKDLDFGSFVDPQSLTLDIRGMVREVIRCSRSPRVSEKELVREIAETAVSPEGRWLYARGHDAVEVMLLALQGGLGSPSAMRIGPAAIESGLRMSYERSFFEKTGLYEDSRRWAESEGVALWIARNPLPSGRRPSP
jgi:hypothetical protein